MHQKSTRFPKPCTVCGVMYLPRPGRQESSRFCSSRCFGIGNRGKRNPNTIGRYLKPSGYVYILAPDHPLASKQGFVAEHRIVMEKMLGRLLEPNEIVHHRDGNRSNNAPDNLEVMTQAEHAGLHLKGNTYARDLRGDRWAIKWDSCRSCGRTDRKHWGHGLCGTCYNRHLRQGIPF